jgi:hypothetical protein
VTQRTLRGRQSSLGGGELGDGLGALRHGVFLNTRKFRGMGQYLDVEGEAEVQRRRFII